MDDRTTGVFDQSVIAFCTPLLGRVKLLPREQLQLSTQTIRLYSRSLEEETTLHAPQINDHAWLAENELINSRPYKVQPENGTTPVSLNLVKRYFYFLNDIASNKPKNCLKKQSNGHVTDDITSPNTKTVGDLATIANYYIGLVRAL